MASVWCCLVGLSALVCIGVLAVAHLMAYGMTLNDAGVPVEMHLYAAVGHAFGMRPTSAPITTEWPKLADKWLATISIAVNPAHGK